MDGLNMRNLLTKFLKDQGGASAVEYAILMSLIGGAMIVAVGLLGTKITGVFTSITALLT